MEYISDYEVTTCHSREKELDWYDQGDETIFHREDKEEQIRAALQLKSDGRLDKVKRT